MEKKGVLVPMLLAIAAAILYLMVLTSKERALSNNYEMGQVLVARVDLPERTVLKEDMVEAVSVPRRFMEQDAFEVKTPSDIKMINNLVTRIRIPKGNQITQSALISLSPDAGLSVKVPPGYRGAILSVDPEMKALIKPGDHVDVLVTFDAVMADGHKEKVTATILQNVLVIAVGTNMGQGMNAKQFNAASASENKAAAFSEKSMISVALNPDEAQYLALAMVQGQISVIVRGLGDVEMHPMEMASFRRLFK
ncbi:MAG: Flp pilus assembly protein CpaB [Elusimicrobia bacterium]|nr:Flp pilus assembly protein CpaB [Elusimicrobiota bacterium]MDE2236379.1 Flp pilus assembly protein CpaB [Elusimicrobiota bacterium]MDE2426208.1 Flp pilus assembly protein CpaB [Elusimicrobiota bacterium]